MNLEYLEKKISKSLRELNSVFYDLRYKEELCSYHPEDYDLKGELTDLEDLFAYHSSIIFKSCQVYFEHNNLQQYLKDYIKNIEPILKDKRKLLSESYNHTHGEAFSDTVGILSEYLAPFPAFSNQANINDQSKGIEYLENILESTGVILNDFSIIPKNEIQVYTAVKIVIKSTFPNVSFPTESFQKTAKCYIPDLLIPSLKCAVEYKYANNEKRLAETIDQILIDVKGYDKNRSYKLFYAVFYVKSGVITKKRFDQIWHEKEFPENWKGILIQGN